MPPTVSDDGEPHHQLSAGDDLREQLVNGGATGRITDVSLPEVNITRVNGVLYDLDPKLYRAGLLPVVPPNPRQFYEQVAAHWLSRDPTLAKAEVRDSGTGLHAILRLRDALTFVSDADRRRWIGILKTIQAGSAD